MYEIKAFETKYLEAVIRLVLHCQNDGTRPRVSVADQPELLNIEEKYFAGGGFFWIAVERERLAGTIGLMNYGNGTGILKKFFADEKYRGKPYHLGQKLYARLLDFALEHNYKELILDTPKNTARAHQFYEKAGFIKIPEERLPVKYDYPYEECDFFHLSLL